MNNTGLVSLDINAFSETISTIISEVVKTALPKNSLNENMRQHTVEDSSSINASLAGQSQTNLSSDSITEPRATISVTEPVQVKEIIHCFWFPTMLNLNSFLLACRVGSKIKTNIWAKNRWNLRLDLHPTLKSTSIIAISMAPSTGPLGQPQLTLRPYDAPKKVTYIQQ